MKFMKFMKFMKNTNQQNPKIYYQIIFVLIVILLFLFGYKLSPYIFQQNFQKQSQYLFNTADDKTCLKNAGTCQQIISFYNQKTKQNQRLNIILDLPNPIIIGEKFIANAVSMGNPHCIIFTDKDTKAAALKYGSEIENNPVFPEKTNVEFIKILSRSEINLDVWERGCGITLACGTGACASVVAGILNGVLDNKVKVNLPGGQLTIEWNGSKDDVTQNVYMTGPATFSFVGEIDV